MKGCKYCEYKKRGYETAYLADTSEQTVFAGEIGVNLFYFRNTKELVAYFGIEGDGEGLEAKIKIKYCPFCGRLLTDLADGELIDEDCE